MRRLEQRKPSFVKADMSVGANLTSRHVRLTVAIGWRADIARIDQPRPIYAWRADIARIDQPRPIYEYAA